MKIDSAFLLQHFDYTRWATGKTLNACKALTPAELNQQLYNSFGGVLGTLLHLFYSDRIWISRLEGRPRSGFSDPGENYTLEQLETAWFDVLKRQAAYAATVKDDQVESVLHYTNLRGVECDVPIWQVIMHMVNHGTYHRGQVATMLRQLGHEAVSTDLHVYYLEKQQTAQRA